MIQMTMLTNLQLIAFMHSKENAIARNINEMVTLYGKLKEMSKTFAFT